MTAAERWSRWIFGVASIYGALVLVSLYFRPVEGVAAFYYGFTGSALVMQAVYFTIATRPLHYRALMPIAVGAKLSFVIPCAILYARGQLSQDLTAGASVDLLLAILFAGCWLAIRKQGGVDRS